MAKNTITTPIKDAVMADNSTLSSNEIKKRIDTAAASILPEVSGSDEGKVLTVGSDGSWEAAPVPVTPTEFKRFIAYIEYDFEADTYYYIKNDEKSTVDQFVADVQGYDEVIIDLNMVDDEANIEDRLYLRQESYAPMTTPAGYYVLFVGVGVTGNEIGYIAKCIIDKHSDVRSITVTSYRITNEE